MQKLAIAPTESLQDRVIPPREIDLQRENLSLELRSFRIGFDFYEYAAGLKEKDDATRLEVFLAVIGDAALDIVYSLAELHGKKWTIDRVMNALERHFVSGKKVDFIA